MPTLAYNTFPNQTPIPNQTSHLTTMFSDMFSAIPSLFRKAKQGALLPITEPRSISYTALRSSSLVKPGEEGLGDETSLRALDRKLYAQMADLKALLPTLKREEDSLRREVNSCSEAWKVVLRPGYRGSRLNPGFDGDLEMGFGNQFPISTTNPNPASNAILTKYNRLRAAIRRRCRAKDAYNMKREKRSKIRNLLGPCPRPEKKVIPQRTRGVWWYVIGVAALAFCGGVVVLIVLAARGELGGK
ncbi:hypothetical protein HYFRA_00004104 [Hymenoscyphus fraxineus]|uniref:Uncharacterized protein n=1 Tax=Hymenoscyphus fraxineus TaxID=746836 RepID=A0A9N9KMI1_9HELO|nr:hypothetical protein HYFRA_00004104 [Hymenoscyphus fraxineus]